MVTDIDSLLDRVKLPPLSFDLLQQLNDENCDLNRVVKSISLDPALTANLLRICNSSVFGASEPISTVDEAVRRAGFKSVYILATTLYGNSCFSGFATIQMDARELWEHSVATAFNARLVARAAGLDGNSLFTAGLLHDIGKVVLAQRRGAAQFNFCRPASADLLRAENDRFGITHPDVGAALLEKWKLPSPLVHAVRYHHEPASSPRFEKFVAAVTVSNLLSHATEHVEILDGDEFGFACFMAGVEPGSLNNWKHELEDSHELISSLSALAG